MGHSDIVAFLDNTIVRKPNKKRRRAIFLGIGSMFVFFLFGSIMALPLFNGRNGLDVLSDMVGGDSFSVDTLGDEPPVDNPAYDYEYFVAPSNSFGMGDTVFKTVNWSHFKNLFKNNFQYDLEYRIGSGDWVSAKQYLTIGLDWQDDGYWKINLTFTKPPSPGMDVRFTVGMNKVVLDYVEPDSDNPYCYYLNYSANDTEVYNCYFNFSDLMGIPGLVFNHGVSDNLFWFRFRKDDVPANSETVEYVFDPTFGVTSGDARSIYCQGDNLHCTKGKPSSNGNVVNFTWYSSSTSWTANEEVKGALYNSDLNLIAATAEHKEGGWGWWTFDFTNSTAITAGNVYYIGLFHDDIFHIGDILDDEANDIGGEYNEAMTYPNFESPIGGSAFDTIDTTRSWFFYVTYTESGGEPPLPPDTPPTIESNFTDAQTTSIGLNCSNFWFNDSEGDIVYNWMNASNGQQWSVNNSNVTGYIIFSGLDYSSQYWVNCTSFDTHNQTWFNISFNTTSAPSEWQQLSEWNLTLSNTSAYQQLSEWNLTISNLSNAWNTLATWNLTISNLSSSFSQISEWNLTISNSSSFQQLNEWNLTISNTTIFSGLGSGTTADPYQITNCEELNETRNFLWANFTLMNDIDLDACNIESWNGGEGFIPIGYAEPTHVNDIPFTGSFDGQNHTINHLFINNVLGYVQGLFGYTLNSIIKNICIENVNITGKTDIGGLIGNPINCEIRNCYSTGIIRGGNNVGGLLGELAYGIVSNCYSTVYVVGNSESGDCFGGLIGINYLGSIENCSASGDIYAVMGDEDKVGGLIGSASSEDTVTNCYARGNVTGDDWVGGLIGTLYGDIITNCYSTGLVTGDTYIGGLIGLYDSGTITNSYWDNETSGTETSDGGTGRTTAQMTYPYEDYDPPCEGLYEDWDLDTNASGSSIWVHADGGQNDGYPLFRWQYVYSPPVDEWQQLVEWNLTISNQSSFQQLSEWNLTISNLSNAWYQKSIWNVTLVNNSGWFLLQNWNLTISNNSNWLQINNWNVTISNLSNNWVQQKIWNLTISNTSNFQQLNEWNLTINNQSIYSLLNEWNLTISNLTNNPPVITVISPVNNSIDIPITIGAMNITIEDPEGDTFSYHWACSDGSYNSASGNTNGTKILMIDTGPLNYCREYTWWVNATDNKGAWTNNTYNFTTVCPTWNLINNWNLTLSNTSNAWYQQIEWNLTISNLTGGNWQTLSTWNLTISNQSIYLLLQEWNLTITNTTNWAISNTWNLTLSNTTPLINIIITNEHPTNQSNIPTIIPSIYFTINALDGSPLNYTIYWGENTDNLTSNISYGESILNGTYYDSFTNVTDYGQTYYWSVNATDGTIWVNHTYHFRTRHESMFFPIGKDNFTLGLMIGGTLIPVIVLLVLRRRKKKLIK